MALRFLICFFSASAFLVLGDFAVAEGMDPMAENRKSEQCFKTKEVFYRSQTLKSPISESSVYFDTVLRRIRGGKVPQGNGEEVCLEGGGTPRSHLLEATGGTRIVYKNDPLDYFYVLSPKSFSADGRYLVSEYSADYSGDGGIGIAIFSVDSKYAAVDSEIKYCRQSDDSQYPASHITFKGFLSASQFIIECHAVYGAALDGPDLWHEIIDLQKREVKKISSQNLTLLRNLKSYGAVISESQILKVQIFP